MLHQAFNPCGPTYLLEGATTAPTAIQILPVGAADANQYRFHNAGSNPAWIGYSGVSAAAALTNAVVPTAGSPQYVVPVKGGESVIVTLPKNVYMSPITTGGASSIFVTPGRGV